MIKIKNLFFTYNKSSSYLLNDINLNINKGNYVSILGDNGSGKSTLLKLLLKTIKPSSGVVNVDTKSIGYVPQRFESFNSEFPMTVFEVMNCHRRIINIKDARTIDENLDTVGMRSFKNSLLGNLSGGQQQKIFIARALMGNPELIILDEPSTGVDVQSQDEIYSLIKHLNKVHGITVITVEHNLKAALANSDFIFELNRGNGRLLTVKEYVSIHREARNYAAV
jgi:zinc transport system ATP-binding protein